MEEGPFLLDDTSYRTIMVERRAPGQPQVLEFSGQVQDAYRRVVEHIACLQEDRASGSNLDVVLIPADAQMGAHPRFRNVFSEFERPSESGSHEASGNWSFVQPRTGDGVPRVIKTWKYLGFESARKRSEFIVVRIRGITAVENPSSLNVTKIFHADGRLKILLEGVLPPMVLDFLVILHGTGPLDTVIHMLDSTTSGSGIYIRLQQPLGINGVLYDSTESKAIASVTFAYKIDSTRELYHVLRGNRSLLDKQRRRIPLENSQSSGRDFGDIPVHEPIHGYMPNTNQHGPPPLSNYSSEGRGAQNVADRTPYVSAGQTSASTSVPPTTPSGYTMSNHDNLYQDEPAYRQRSSAIYESPTGYSKQFNNLQGSPGSQGFSSTSRGHEAQTKPPDACHPYPTSHMNVIRSAPGHMERIDVHHKQGNVSQQPGGYAAPSSMSTFLRGQPSSQGPEQNLTSSVGNQLRGSVMATTQCPGSSYNSALSLGPPSVAWTPSYVRAPDARPQPRVPANILRTSASSDAVKCGAALSNMSRQAGHLTGMPSAPPADFSKTDINYEDAFNIWTDLWKDAQDLRSLVRTLESFELGQSIEAILAQTSEGDLDDTPKMSRPQNQLQSSPSPHSIPRGAGSRPLRFEHLPFLKLDGYMNPFKKEHDLQRPGQTNNLGLSSAPSVMPGQSSGFQSATILPSIPSPSALALPGRGEIPELQLRSYQQKAVETIMSRDGNFLVRAPTGSGKTWIFVECARRMIMKNPEAKVIVLVPTVPLVDQQRAQFDAAGFPANGYLTKSLAGGKPFKREAFERNSVLVMTVQILENKLRDEMISFSDFQMLVLDEGHHARGDSPYSKILWLYRSQPETVRSSLKVLGFSASITFGPVESEASRNLHNLLEDMCVPVSNIININENDEEIMKTVPKATEEVYWIDRSDEDAAFVTTMTSFLRETLHLYHEHLNNLGVGAVLSLPLPKKIKPGECSSQLSQWKHRASEAVQTLQANASKIDLLASLDFIEIVNSALAGIMEVGRAVVLRIIKDYLVDKVDLNNIQSQITSSLLGTLLKQYCGLAPVKMAAGAPNTPLGEGANPNCGTLPRFVALEDILSRDQFSGENFHCIVFIRTRTAVKEVCRMLQNSPKVGQKCHFRVLVGHSEAEASRKMKINTPGMTGAMQSEVVAWFKTYGRKVLVATSAAEEGLDVQSCELVVRYSVTVTGVERIQSRGRARKEDALYVNIVERSSREEMDYYQSVRQEEAGEIAINRIQGLASVEGGSLGCSRPLA